MSSFAQDQADEMEALQSIFGDDYTELSRDPPQFDIFLKPHQDRDTSQQVSMKLRVRFPSEYPNEAPVVDFVEVKQIQDKHLAQARGKVESVVAENMGTAVIFNVVMMLREFLLEVDSIPKDMHEEFLLAIKQQQQAEPEEDLDEDTSKTIDDDIPPIGITPVTLETFADWKRQFDAEMEATRPTQSSASKRKLTGKQLFERDASLATSDSMFVGEDEEAVVVDAKHSS